MLRALLFLFPVVAYAQPAPDFTVNFRYGSNETASGAGVGNAINSFLATGTQRRAAPVSVNAHVSSQIHQMHQNTHQAISAMKIKEPKIKSVNWSIEEKSPEEQIHSRKDNWIQKKARHIDEKLSHLSNDYDTSQLSSEVKTWGEFSMDKKKVLVLTDQYATEYERFNNSHSDIDSLTETSFQVGLEFLTESAQIAGSGIGNFKRAYAASEASLEIAKGLLDFGLGVTPGVSIGKDAYEAITGHRLLDGSELDFTERSFAFLGVVTAGGSNLVKGSVKAITAIGKAHGVEKVIDATKGIWNTKNLRPAIASLRKYGVSYNKRKDVVTAFTKESQVKILTEDKKVYRYFTPGKSDPRKEWVTEKLVKDPQRDLALKYPGPYEVQKWTIPKGTEVLEGLVAPNFGMPGGAHQIFVFDKGVLK